MYVYVYTHTYLYIYMRLLMLQRIENRESDAVAVTHKFVFPLLFPRMP